MAVFTIHQLDRNLADRDLDTFRRLAFNDDEYTPEDFKLYNPVARVEAVDLEDVFRITNLWNNPDAVRRFMPMHSTSVGDIIETHTDGHRYFMVAGTGFKEVEVV